MLQHLPNLVTVIDECGPELADAANGIQSGNPKTKLGR